MRRLVLRSFQSPGDILMLTAAVRDLHAARPGQFQTDVRTSADPIWKDNPHITPLKESEPGVQTLDMHYPLIHQSNQRPYHFIHGYAQFLEQELGISIPVTSFHGDVHLADEEKTRPSVCDELGIAEGFWIVVAGGVAVHGLWRMPDGDSLKPSSWVDGARSRGRDNQRLVGGSVAGSC